MAFVMKVLLCPVLAGCLVVLCLPGGHAVAGQTGAVVVARVNGEPVTRAELDRTKNNPLTRQRLRQELGRENQDPKDLDRLALQMLIHRRLLLQEADRRKIQITDTELDKAVNSLRLRFDDLMVFGQWMKEQGLDERSLFDSVKEDILTDRVIALLVEGVQADEEQVQSYYEAHKDDIVIGEEVRLRLIAVRNREKADGVLAALRKGASFDRIARQRSVGLRAAQGGDTGWVDTRNLPQALHKAVSQMKTGDVAGPLQKGPGEFLIVGLEGRRPVRAKTLSDARPEIERILLPAEQQKAVRNWLEVNENKAEIDTFP